MLQRLVVLAAALVAVQAYAIRPFVTDDARVVGGKLAQLETWVLVDRLIFEHNALVALGPTPWLELTLGLTHGAVHSGEGAGYSLTGPILQAKFLLKPAEDHGWPGFAIALGALPPWGLGAFVPPGWSGFTYLAVTESLFEERLLLHANLGFALGDEPDGAGARRFRPLLTAGFGFQARIVAGLHGIAEIYHGDPYDPRSAFGAMQVGFRYIFSDAVQVDGTFGSSLVALSGRAGHASTEQWGTLGLRLVTPELW